MENVSLQTPVMVGVVTDARELYPRENPPMALTSGPRTSRLLTSQNTVEPAALEISVLEHLPWVQTGSLRTHSSPLLTEASVLCKHIF